MEDKNKKSILVKIAWNQKKFLLDIEKTDRIKTLYDKCKHEAEEDGKYDFFLIFDNKEMKNQNLQLGSFMNWINPNLEVLMQKGIPVYFRPPHCRTFCFQLELHETILSVKGKCAEELLVNHGRDLTPANIVLKLSDFGECEDEHDLAHYKIDQIAENWFGIVCFDLSYQGL